MILLLDLGNSRIKWAVLSPEGLSAQQYLPHKTDLNLQLQQLQRDCSQYAIQKIYAASVATGLNTAIKNWACEHWQLEVIFLTTATKAAGVINGYQHPQQLGVDRWLALLAAKAMQPDIASCVVDCGTAITIDVIDAQGQHLGGLILPGLNMMQTALLDGTNDLKNLVDKVNKMDNAKHYKILAQNTAEGIKFGTITAVIGLLERILGYLALNYAKVALIFTGGAAAEILPLVKHQHVYVPDLVLRGMAVTINVDGYR
jgi:type III pantothenate kinase